MSFEELEEEFEEIGQPLEPEQMSTALVPADRPVMGPPPPRQPRPVQMDMSLLQPQAGSIPRPISEPPRQPYEMPQELFDAMNRDDNQFMLEYEEEEKEPEVDVDDEEEELMVLGDDNPFAILGDLSNEDIEEDPLDADLREFAEQAERMSNSWSDLSGVDLDAPSAEAEALATSAAYSAGVLAGMKRPLPQSLENIQGLEKAPRVEEEKEREEKLAQRPSKRPLDTAEDKPPAKRREGAALVGFAQTFFKVLMQDFPVIENKNCPVEDFFDEKGNPKPKFYNEIKNRAETIEGEQRLSPVEKQIMYRKLYRRLSFRLHPDKNPDCPELAHEVQKEMNSKDTNKERVMMGDFIRRRSSYKNMMSGSIFKK